MSPHGSIGFESNSHTKFLVRIGSISETNRSIKFDWVRLSSITEQFD